jgi:hypothetical protein
MVTYIRKNDQQLGPFDDSHVVTGMRDGLYHPDDFAWREGRPGWEPLRNLFPPSGAASEPQRLGDSAGVRMILPVGRSGWAIAAGYLGLLSLVVFPAPIALVVSVIAIIAIQKSKGSPHPKHGMGRAIFGLVMGVLGTAIILFLLFSRSSS